MTDFWSADLVMVTLGTGTTFLRMGNDCGHEKKETNVFHW